MTSNLPPLSTSGVFSVSSTIEIDAPREKVWSVLLDFGSYNEWNPFVRGQTVVDASKNPLEDQTPVEGQYLYIHPVHLPPTMGEPTWFQKQSAFVKIVTVDQENYRTAWQGVLPAFILSTHRWQALGVVGEGEGQKTRYETIEVFSGVIAYAVKFFMQAKLKQGFDAMAEGLKQRSEQA